MKALDKLRVLLPHWIEHNKGHAGEFSKWAASLREQGGDEAAGLLEEAAQALDQADRALRQALNLAGGPLTEHGHHHEHHHHH